MRSRAGFKRCGTHKFPELDDTLTPESCLPASVDHNHMRDWPISRPRGGDCEVRENRSDATRVSRSEVPYLSAVAVAEMDASASVPAASVVPD